MGWVLFSVGLFWFAASSVALHGETPHEAVTVTGLLLYPAGNHY